MKDNQSQRYVMARNSNVLLLPSDLCYCQLHSTTWWGPSRCTYCKNSTTCSFRTVRANKPKATVTFAELPMTVTLHDWPEGLLCSADHTNLKGSMQLLRNLHKNSPFDSLDATIPTCNYLGIYTRAKVTN